MILYRPVGTKELELIVQSGNKAFPPRLPDQPIFYPVLNEKYAIEIASNWNVKYNDDHKGYVTEFEVDDKFCAKYEPHTVGADYHRELWVPAEELEDISSSFKGVEKSFAIQAGREVRVMVVPEQISDDDMVLLARDISKKIENELEYPGQIKVNVIRESRTVDYAK